MRLPPTDPTVAPAPPPPQVDAPLAEMPASPGRIAWVRRRRSLGRMARLYRRNRMGMAGLVILGIFVLVAFLAPLIASEEGLDPTCECTGAPLQGPSAEFPFGTDDLAARC